MNNPDFHRAIGRIQRRHGVHFLVQSLLMGGLVLAADRTGVARLVAQPSLVAGFGLALLAASTLAVSGLLVMIARRMVPNLRRRAEENLRIYQGRILLRDSLLILLGLPLLVAYTYWASALLLAAYGALLLLLARLTVPTAPAYQRWLLS